MSEQWKIELTGFLNMAQPQKIIWLSKLLFIISMFARDTYQVGTDQVERANELRKYNELLHRIATFQLEIATEKSIRKPDEQFFLMLAEAVDEIGINISTLLSEIGRMK
ncbi:MAG: hypothetical protein HC877_07270 [Thioploca sp.]|nr:hypothetical protein [Thioploca sp.]